MAGPQNIEMGHSNFLYYFAFGPDINIVLLVLTSIRKVKMSISRKVYHPIKFLKRFQLSKMEKYLFPWAYFLQTQKPRRGEVAMDRFIYVNITQDIISGS